MQENKHSWGTVEKVLTNGAWLAERGDDGLYHPVNIRGISILCRGGTIKIETPETDRFLTYDGMGSTWFLDEKSASRKCDADNIDILERRVKRENELIELIKKRGGGSKNGQS